MDEFYKYLFVTGQLDEEQEESNTDSEEEKDS